MKIIMFAVLSILITFNKVYGDKIIIKYHNGIITERRTIQTAKPILKVMKNRTHGTEYVPIQKNTNSNPLCKCIHAFTRKTIYTNISYLKKKLSSCVRADDKELPVNNSIVIRGASNLITVGIPCD